MAMMNVCRLMRRDFLRFSVAAELAPDP